MRSELHKMPESLLHEELVSLHQQDEMLLSRVELCELEVREALRTALCEELVPL